MSHLEKINDKNCLLIGLNNNIYNFNIETNVIREYDLLDNFSIVSITYNYQKSLGVMEDYIIITSDSNIKILKLEENMKLKPMNNILMEFPLKYFLFK